MGKKTKENILNVEGNEDFDFIDDIINGEIENCSLNVIYPNNGDEIEFKVFGLSNNSYLIQFEPICKLSNNSEYDIDECVEFNDLEKKLKNVSIKVCYEECDGWFTIPYKKNYDFEYWLTNQFIWKINNYGNEFSSNLDELEFNEGDYEEMW